MNDLKSKENIAVSVAVEVIAIFDLQDSDRIIIDEFAQELAGLLKARKESRDSDFQIYCNTGKFPE